MIMNNPNATAPSVNHLRFSLVSSLCLISRPRPG
jgi:hypothetical protein